MILQCPNCGSKDGVFWRDRGKYVTYYQGYGGDLSTRTVEIETDLRISAPKQCRCVKCGRVLDIEDVEHFEER